MQRRALSDSEKLDWLRLARSDRVGPVAFRELLARFGTAARALDALPELARGGGGRPYRAAERGACERELAGLARIGARLIAACEPDYPAPLAAIPDAPPVIAVHGRVGLLSQTAVGVVGARNASAVGRRFAAALAADLAGAGLAVVSGLARGIDTAAHEAALGRTGSGGGTVAVVAGGIDVAYPPENGELMRRICTEGGCIVAEQSLGLAPRARHFPHRNRIISGLSRAVVVVEATLKSGSRITARLAADQGREVLAVPGSPLDPRARGCNQLIRDGALLCESAADVLDAIKIHMLLSFTSDFLSSTESVDMAHLSGEGRLGMGSGDAASAHDKILELLSFTPVSVDELARRSHLSPAALAQALLELELAGRVMRHPGGQISLMASGA